MLFFPRKQVHTRAGFTPSAFPGQARVVRNPFQIACTLIFCDIADFDAGLQPSSPRLRLSRIRNRKKSEELRACFSFSIRPFCVRLYLGAGYHCGLEPPRDNDL